MGQEINTINFSAEDEAIFHSKLREETKVLKGWFDEKRFNREHPKCGLELEAWTVTEDFIPAPISDNFIKALGDPLVVPEISKFNFELNSKPYPIIGNVFSKIEGEISLLWKKCENFAEDLNHRTLMIGTLPTLRDYMLTMDNLSPEKRYFALNEQVMKLRAQQPISIDFEGRDEIHLKHNDVITECAATSLQVHFGVNQENAPKYYNSSIVASSLVSAVCANSPFFYGKELWDESRIPIFEQSVNIKSFRNSQGEHSRRVSLGNGYVRKCIMELFLENLNGYPILLPDIKDTGSDKINHLLLQNGTIWRWNRPLIGLCEKGIPGLRLEFRIPSAGPTMTDAISNLVFQIAVVEYLYGIDGLEEKIPFPMAKENFYNACQKGLSAEITWLDGKKVNINELLLKEILPKASIAMKKFGVDQSDIEFYLQKNIKSRLEKEQNGANWQKGFVRKHGPRFQEMMEVYYDYQKKNIPVHLWGI